MRRVVSAAVLLLGLVPATARAQSEGGYQIGVVSESGDRITWLRFSDGALSVLRVIPVGVMPTEIDGPHNLAVAPDQTAYYITIAHGTPFGGGPGLEGGRRAAEDRCLGEVLPPRSA